MSRIRSSELLLVLAFAAAAPFARAAEVVRTSDPQDEVVIAERVLAPCRSDGIQSAVDAVAALGGGTVFLARGTYVIDAPVTVRRGVTLRGECDRDAPARSTVLAVVCGAGDEEGPAAFSLEHGSGLVGLVFHYPDQTLAKPTPYPWTVRTSLRNAGNNQTVRDCVFVNSWRAIAVGPETNECHTFRNLRVCALKTGISVDMTTDIGRCYDVLVSPDVWTGSGFPSSPASADLVRFLQRDGVIAVDYARSDWEFIRALEVERYRVGVRFRRGRDGSMNGVMAGCRVSGCGEALRIDALNEVGLAVYDSDFLAGNATNVFCAESFDGVAQFHSCAFGEGRVVLGPKGAVNIRECRFPEKTRAGGTIDASAGGRLLYDGGTTTHGRPVSYGPAETPRPKGDGVVFAEVDANADDCTAAIQSALDAAAGMKDGATVYLAAGIYRCRGALKVPSRVELRGASAVPHHTMSGGTVFFVIGGRGEEDGEPFCSLAPGSGLRGVSFWYPEQDVGSPVPYPWTVRALGPDCWLTDVNVANSWRGVDFATRPSDRHRVSGLSGACYRVGLAVGNCATTGWVQDVQMNPHYVYRRPPDHPLREPKERGRGEPAFMLFQRDWLEALVFTDCADERISGTFVYAARDGIAFRGKTKAEVLIHGTDTGCRALTMDASEGSVVRGALVQLVSLGRLAESSIAVGKGNAGELRLYASQFWPQYPLLDQYGTGLTVLDQFNGVAGPVKVHGGRAEIVNGYFQRPHRGDCVEKCASASVTARGCQRSRGEFSVGKCAHP